MDRVLPLFRAKSVRSLSILTAMVFNAFDIMYNEEFMNRYSRISGITDLAFDDCRAKPKDIIPLLNIPKSLRSFRWTQKFSCFDRGSCTIPFYDTLGESLVHHKQTLEVLDLDLRQTLCQGKGHGANPHVKYVDMLEEECSLWRHDWHLLGSLKTFSSLRSLKINPEVLCGDRVRGSADMDLADSLPPQLEELTLIYQFYVMEKAHNYQEGRDFTDIELFVWEQKWMEQLVYLVQNSASKFPKLRKITVVDWNPSIDWPREEDKEIFRDVKVACAEAGISFLMVKETSPWQTPVPHFLEILPTRNSGSEN
jgi:hypothetical protein